MSFFIFLYFSFLLFLFHPASSRQPLCHEGERSTLLRFKESFSIDCKLASFDPSTYSKTELWNLEGDMSDCCSWDGVECNEDTGYVIKLDLNSSCLYGPINSTSTLFNLVHLQWLSLADNDFNFSKIPSEIKNLSNLSHLNLSWSAFSGQIPSKILELSNLESLDLSGYNMLELQQPGLESLIRKLTNLRVLNLGRVNISSSLPHVLTDLSSLNFLSLAQCKLKGTILSSLGNLKNLVHLDLSDNNLWGTIPSSLGNLTNLVYLGLSRNNFWGTSLSSLENLTNLAHLEMRDCNLSGQDPASSLSNLTQLYYLDLSDNNIGGEIPLSLMNLNQLSMLYLSYNQLSGHIPSQLSNLTQLEFLDLLSNKLQGTIPSSLGKNTKLTYLDLSDNNIGGEIPLSLMNLNRLSTLDLSFNQLSGHIPSQLSNLTQLEYLDLLMNKLQGTIPSSFGNLTNLVYLDLSRNDLWGTIPLSLMNLNQLSKLILSNNQLSGHIPSQLSNLTQLEYLSLSRNKLQGTIPSSLYNLANLAYLDLSYCNFSSLDPDSSQSNLTQLYSLDLSHNNLSIPSSSLSWIGKNTKLTHLGLSNNNIGGEIPLSFMNLNQLPTLDLSSNQLSGHIPSQISNLTQLKSLDLSLNKLQGSIPSSISELNHLESLYLYSNNLSGTIELQMFLPLKNLSVLDISSNRRLSLLSNFSVNTSSHKFQILRLGSCNHRSFPDFLRYQDQLYSLDLSSNNIPGQIPGWLFNLSLQDLNLSHNLLTGFDQRPDVLPWTSLYYLDLRFNRLQGPLPFPSNYTEHYLVSNNKLSGEIPSWMCKLNSLYALDLSNNNLSGKLPKCLGNFSYGLSMLDLQNNKFYGSIHLNFINGTELKMIDLSNNLLRGKIPRSLVNCTILEYLDLGSNKINDTFPSWMGSLPKLEVLNLKSNELHGVIEEPKSGFVFPKLRMIDLSHNRFIGKFPSKYFQCWNAMKFDNKSTVLTYMMKEDGTAEDWYDYSLIVYNKGREIEYVKIPNMLTGIWLSNNAFEGEIPATISTLKGLRYLDLSNNNLTGGIPSSLDNLTILESLVLSNNKLSGKIPHQLVSLTFLAFFNVSYNHLEGPIPQGPQFNTFDYTSYEGNPGLCGQPLSRKCGNSELPRNNDDDEGSESPFAFGWKVVAIGYACGLIIGVVVGHIFCTKKYEWFVKVFGMPLKRMERKRGRRRN